MKNNNSELYWSGFVLACIVGAMGDAQGSIRRFMIQVIDYKVEEQINGFY